MRLFLIDHNDSFTFNLANAFRCLGAEVAVVSSSAHPHIRTSAQAYILSPGPGRPAHYPETLALLQQLPPATPILGVCLGMQILNEWSGGETVRAPTVMHGKTSVIFHNGRGIFEGISSPFTAMRYHSLACRVTSPDWEIAAWSIENNKFPMAICHRLRPWWGVQFHPESFLTSEGMEILKNFIFGLYLKNN